MHALLRTSRTLLASLALCLATSTPVIAQQASPLARNGQIGDYVGETVSIPMRDGAKMHAQVWRPRARTGLLPILLQVSPYGFDPEHVLKLFGGAFSDLAKDGFIFVLEDVRGRFGSEGNFVMLQPKASSPKEIDQSTDIYDSIDWLTKKLPRNNGAVGMFGVSYPGWTTAMSTVDPHPALKAISVQASPEDMFVNDDFHHNGAFRLQYGWEFATFLEAEKGGLTTFDFKEDPYSWFLKQGQLSSLDTKVFGKPLPTWQNFAEHPDYDAFWKSNVTSRRMPAKVAVPNLIVAGWWDQEDFYGAMTIYRNQEKGDAKGRNFLVVGPWNHGGWTRPSWDRFGPFDLGSDTATHYRQKIETPWFRHWLKGDAPLGQPEAMIFETGSNQWRSYKSWPSREGVSKRALYFHANGRLSFDPPAASEAPSAQFVSDPANPIPYRQRPIAGVISGNAEWATWLSDDQAPFAKRDDVLVWQTDILSEDITVRGDILAKLFASTTGSDADWVVKLIDVFPSDAATPAEVRGRQWMIANDVFRGRYRQGFERPQAIVPNQVLDYAIDLHSASHLFKKGHRIAVQVQSSWFPLIDRNPQAFQPNIYRAAPETFKAQTHKVFHTPRQPSAIWLDLAAADLPRR
ncbi:CocE/NonD family hydrolase [Sphingomonas gei]|nr:CocE/NonD family hydrolase [Sphingomonas gei]